MASKNGSPKKRNKKNCRMKRATMMATYGTSDLLLVYVGGKRETHALDKKAGTPVHIGPTIADSFHSIPFKWHVYLAVMCRTQTGEEYIQSEEMNFPAPYRRDIIQDMLNKRHDELIRTCNPEHVLNIGWIASTTPHKFDDKHCNKLFTSQDGWDYLAKWEMDKVVKETPNNPRCPKCKKFVKKKEYQEFCYFGKPCSKCEGKS